jgi:hypothetical protein
MACLHCYNSDEAGNETTRWWERAGEKPRGKQTNRQPGLVETRGRKWAATLPIYSNEWERDEGKREREGPCNDDRVVNEMSRQATGDGWRATMGSFFFLFLFWCFFGALFLDFHDSPKVGWASWFVETLKERENIEGAAGDYLAAFSGHEIK